jgi:hypothetical protein
MRVNSLVANTRLGLAPFLRAERANRGSTVELHLFGLIGAARHPDMHKFRIIRFFFANRLHW